MNIKKMFTALSAMVVAVTMTMPSVSVFGAEYSQELQDAYNWAYSKGVTTMSPIDNANMYGAITRAEMAKMLSVYSVEVLGNTPDTSKACTFTDIDSVKGDLHDFIIESCQLGIMGQGITAFRPYDTISRAEFGTALSRVLWGSKYEGGTPYYASHLNALKAEGIMNQIANAESTKEIRGWVMLMLMRSEEGGAGIDCEEATIALACLDPENEELYKECPAACREDANNDNGVVKSGDLAVTATAATERKAILDGGVSDLDTITLKASEPITVNSITLERYGYSTANDVDAIWLEDGDGNKIADEKTLSPSKDTVTLKIKKEYREMDASNALTIVLRTAKYAEGKTTYDAEGKLKPGTTIGFKVVDVDASAKNLDLSDYNPYTYELANYDGSKVTVEVKGNDKEYNYEEGEFYEVSRLRVKAGASILSLNGITLTNKGGKVTYTKDPVDAACPAAAEGYTRTTNDPEHNKCEYTSETDLKALDLDEFVSKVKVTADGKEVSGLKYNVTKDNELVLSWDTIEVAINKDVQLIVSVAMENLDEFGSVVRLVLDETGDLNATEKKTGARVTVAAPGKTANTWKVYTFNGSKIKFTNTKLSSTIDASQGSEDVVIAKGTVTVAEEIKLTELKFTADVANVIEDMTLTIGGESYDASVSNNKTEFVFKNVYIEKSGDLELSVDIVDEEFENTPEVQVRYNNETTSIGKKLFAGDNNGRYETSRKPVKEADVSGSISISKLKVQESKGALTNKVTSKQEFVTKENVDRVVFDGTYTAKKGTVNLDNVKITYATGEVRDGDNNVTTDYDVHFVVEIDGKEVADLEPDLKDDDADFDPITVEAGKSVPVKVTAYVSSDYKTSTTFEYKLSLAGKDDKGNDAGGITKSMAKMEFVDADTIVVSTNSTVKKDDVILADSNQVLASFIVEPDGKATSAKLDTMTFDVTSLKALLDAYYAPETNLANWDGSDVFDITFDPDEMSFKKVGTKYLLEVKDFDKTIEGETKIELTYKEDLDAGDYAVILTEANGDDTINRTFNRKAVDALVKVASQEGDGKSVTTYKFDITYSDDATNKSIEWVRFTYDDGADASYTKTSDVACNAEKTYYTKEGENYNVVATCVTDNLGTYYERNEATHTVKQWDNVSKGETYEIANTNATRYVTKIEYKKAGATAITLEKDQYSDFFKVGGSDLKAFDKD